MTTIVHVWSGRDEFANIRQDWDRLAGREFRFYPAFPEIYNYVVAERKAFRLIVAQDERGVLAIACFVLDPSHREFWLAGRKLFDLPVRKARLQGAAILGAPDAILAGAMLDRILVDPGVAFVNLGDVDKSTGLYAAVQKRRWSWLKNEADWRATRRMIILPTNFRDYLASLRPTTRKAAMRDKRIFARLDAEFRVFTRPEQVRGFLVDASGIRDNTYQAGNTFGIDAPAWRIRMLEEQAAAGKLLAFAAYVDGKPCAFLWGEISYEVFNFEYTGYDPVYRKYCAGTAILLNSIEYLIENKSCARFDFGGRDVDYKERFATDAIDCVNIILGSYRQPTAALAVVLDRITSAARPIVLRLIGSQMRLKKIKEFIRG